MNETLNFVVNGNTYAINFPTVGDYYAIEASKQSLSLGFYNSLSESSVLSAYNATNMIDIEATLTILCPQLIKDLKCDSFKIDTFLANVSTSEKSSPSARDLSFSA